MRQIDKKKLSKIECPKNVCCCVVKKQKVTRLLGLITRSKVNFKKIQNSNICQKPNKMEIELIKRNTRTKLAILKLREYLPYNSRDYGDCFVVTSVIMYLIINICFVSGLLYYFIKASCTPMLITVDPLIAGNIVKEFYNNNIDKFYCESSQLLSYNLIEGSASNYITNIPWLKCILEDIEDGDKERCTNYFSTEVVVGYCNEGKCANATFDSPVVKCGITYAIDFSKFGAGKYSVQSQMVEVNYAKCAEPAESIILVAQGLLYMNAMFVIIFKSKMIWSFIFGN